MAYGIYTIYDKTSNKGILNQTCRKRTKISRMIYLCIYIQNTEFERKDHCNCKLCSTCIYVCINSVS